MDDEGSALSVTNLSDTSDESNTPNTSNTSNTSSRSGRPFEIITRRFTSRAKKNILTVFPHTMLPIDEIRYFFETEIPRRIPVGSVPYVV